jgi:hypothetical protein
MELQIAEATGSGANGSNGTKRPHLDDALGKFAQARAAERWSGAVASPEADEAIR